MTLNTLETIIKLFLNFYSNFRFDLENKEQAQLWYMELQYMDDYKAVLAARRVISTCDFVTIKNIKQAYAMIDSPTPVDDEEGWGLVMRAVRSYGYSRADEAMNSLPSRVQKAVLYMGGFQAICESDKPDVLRGQFARAMASVNDRIQTEASLGAPLLEQIRQIQAKEENKEKKLIEINKPLAIETKKMSNEELDDKMQSIRDILNNKEVVNS